MIGFVNQTIPDTRFLMLDKRYNSDLYIKYPVSSIQHRFASVNGIMILIPAAAGSVCPSPALAGYRPGRRSFASITD